MDFLDPSTEDITAINFNDFNEYYRHGYLLFYNSQNQLSCGITNQDSVGTIKDILKNFDVDSLKFYRLKETDLVLILEKSFNKLNTDRAINHLSTKLKHTAKTANYPKFTLGFITLFIASLIFFSNSFNLLNNVIYLVQNIFKAILFKRSVEFQHQENFTKKDLDCNYAARIKSNLDNMPIYTIFVPLYKEVKKLKSIISAIDNINYPKEKLDVKFIIEGDDQDTIKALQILSLPRYVHVIKVPFSLPRTKPKAMNYAMAYVKGEYLCIYDAEDRPDPDQLMKALDAFSQLSEEYACVQARLNFYNKTENILTKFFSIEYSLWFDYLIKGLSLYDLPLTLGGTSNHFKVSVLKKIGAWDAYNVTEDAELGVRLYLNGYKVHLLDSETLEESPVGLKNWLLQRIRWIKGFIQTIYVFMISPENHRKLGWSKVFSVYIFIGFSSYSFFCMPWLISIFLLDLHKYVYYSWIINTTFSLIYVYSTACYILKRQKVYPADFVILILWPLYFVLHSIAAYLAIWEIASKPFKWNKTEHGVSMSDL